MAALKPLWMHLEGVAGRLRRAGTLRVASDYDGTLTPIVARPELAVLTSRTRAALDALRRLPGAGVALLSGRALAELRRHVRLPGLHYAGVSGFETWDPRRGREVHVAPGDRLPEALRADLDAWCRRFPGAWLEDKRWVLALHYRAVPERFRDAFGQGVRRRVREAGDRVRLLHGKRLFEVLPAVPCDKASALERWIGGGEDAAVFFFGDDRNDEPALALTRRLRGVSVVVGRSSPHAEYFVSSPAEVTWFLEWLASEWAARTGAAPGARAARARRRPAPGARP